MKVIFINGGRKERCVVRIETTSGTEADHAPAAAIGRSVTAWLRHDLRAPSAPHWLA
jgi:hypothetical protein